MSALRVVPVTLRAARAHVQAHHSHLGAPVGGLFAVGVARDGVLCCVAIVGQPVARLLAGCAEVTRAAFADDAVAFGSVAEWFAALSQRLRGVRVCSGDWSRVLGSSSLWAHVRSSSTGVVGVYLDPPYSEGEQQYAAGGTGTGLSAEVRAWALKHGANPRLRIVLSGYAGEHDELEGEGWRVVEWKANGGFSNASGENVNRHRERLWCSPACVGARQLSLLDLGGAR